MLAVMPRARDRTPALCSTRQRRLAHRVQGHPRTGHAFGQAAADVDDAAALAHVLGRGLRGDERRAHVDDNVRSISSSVTSCSGPINAIPALLTRMSSPPNSAAVCSTAALTSAMSALSARIASARRPSAWICATTASRLVRGADVGDRHIRAFARERQAIAAPMPRLPPVTNAVFPARFILLPVYVTIGTERYRLEVRAARTYFPIGTERSVPCKNADARAASTATRPCTRR